MRNILIGLIIGTHAIASSAFNEYSLAEEKEIGRRTSEMFETRVQVVHDSLIDAYFGDMAAKLAAHMESPFSYSIVVFEGRIPESSPAAALLMPLDYMGTDVPEPISVAGGNVFVPLCMLADAPREEWLVFQIAHAMAHIASRHASRLESRLDVLRMVDLNQEPPDAAVTRRVALLSFSRRFELNADVASFYTMSAAGYDPARVLPLDHVGKRDSEKLFPSLRVNAQRREETLAKVVDRLPKRDYVRPETNFNRAKGIAASRRQASPLSCASQPTNHSI